MSYILRHNLGPSPTVFGVDRKRLGSEVLMGLALLAALLLLVIKPIHQPMDYHQFHDVRALFGIPNLLNVLSNVTFVFAGIAGLWWLRADRHGLPATLSRAYAVMLVGTVMTGFGSAYYHWSPSHASLVWDRLPMVVAFAGFYVAMIGERISLKTADWLLLPLLAYGIGSVLYWQACDDLRAYVLVQFFPLLTIPLMLWWFPAAYSRSADILTVLGLYVLAKVFEAADGFVYGLGHLVSGHTIKHLIAAAAAFWLVRMLQLRRPMPAYGSSSVSQYR